jgi:hypothetical protein
MLSPYMNFIVLIASSKTIEYCGRPRCAMRYERDAQHGIKADATRRLSV